MLIVAQNFRGKSILCAKFSRKVGFCAQNFRRKSMCIIMYAGVRVYLVFDSLKDLKRIGTDASLFFSFCGLDYYGESGGDG